MFAIGGMVGIHAIYLRQSWRCVLYITLLAFAFIGSNGPVGVALVAVVNVLVVGDFVRLDSQTSNMTQRLAPGLGASPGGIG